MYENTITNKGVFVQKHTFISPEQKRTAKKEPVYDIPFLHQEIEKLPLTKASSFQPTNSKT